MINRDRLAVILEHDGETGNVGRPIAEVNHVCEGDRADVRVHVIVYVLRHIEQPFVDPKKVLRLLRVTDHALRKSDRPCSSSANSQPKIARTYAASRLPSISIFIPDARI
mgnify:CR=1 FL=1